MSRTARKEERDGNVASARAHKRVEGALEGERRREFTRAVLTDLRALERMLDEDWFERGEPRIGAEQEMFLVDAHWRPAPAALDMLERLDDPHFTTELAKFNLELNVDPQPFRGDGLARLERQLTALLERCREVGRELGIHPVLVGILPTLRTQDFGLENMVPSPRYEALNAAMTAMRGGAYEISIKGIDELLLRHDSVMVEAANCSFQVHLQVAPDEFARLYNLAQVLAAPLVAIAGNSTLLFGKRLWHETRIALFQQAVDTRSSRTHLRERHARVWFGSRWVRRSVVEIFKEDIARFRSLVGTDLDEDPIEKLDAGEVPWLKALRLHNSTVYRWNRPCYGVIEGRPHLRIECRVLPSGPSVVDEVANAAFWLGLMSELGHRHEDITRHIEFDHAQRNLWAAARDGMGASLVWLDGQEREAQALVLDQLLPAAEAGLRRAGIDEADVARYLSVLDKRVRNRRDGARWQLSSLQAFGDRGAPGERHNALVAALVARQATGRPVAEWDRARLDEADSSKANYLRVDQYMKTDVFTVQEDDPVELVADLMTWERIRHVPVEDAEGKLVGIVSYRALLRHFANEAKERASTRGRRRAGSTSVGDVMRRDVITVGPDTPTLEAIALMRRYRVGCLPVVQGGQLVAMVTEDDFMNIAAELLEQRLRG